METKFYSEIPKGREHSDDVALRSDHNKLIRMDLRLGGCEPYSCGSGQGPVTGSFENGDEL
jgi:hypothetical protein